MHFLAKSTLWCFATLLPTLGVTLDPTYFIAAPNVIRVGVNETIVTHILGDISEEITFPVKIDLKNHPAGNVVYDTQTVSVSKRKPVITLVQVRPEDIAYTTGAPQYVDVCVTSASPNIFTFSDRTPILLSFKAGHVFIQTDKPIYTPKDKAGVYIRLIAVDEQMRPSANKVRLDIMTPHGITIERFDDVIPEDGFVSKSFKLPPSPVLGNWSVAAYYGHEFKHNSTIQFLVKEYVLPKFSVKIQLNVNVDEDRTYLLSNDTSISTLVTANYVFQKPVHGLCRIIYKLLDPDGEMELVKDVNLTLSDNGQCFHRLNIREEVIGSTNFTDYIGRRLHVEAFVANRVTGKVESSINSTLKFVDSPFELKRDKTLGYFKTGFSFDVKIDLVDHNNNPVPHTNVRLSVSGDWETTMAARATNDNGFVVFGINIPAESINLINVLVTTEAVGHLAKHQRTISFSVMKYATSGGNDLLVQPVVSAENEVQISPNGLSVTLQIANQQDVDQVFLFVVAGGKILEPRAEDVIEGTTFNVPITHAMVPNARLVSFFVGNNGQLVADSLWIDVADVCENDIEITVPENNGKNYYEPGQAVRLTVTAKPHTRIKLLGVDSAVYLLQDYHRLTKKKMFSRMAGYDLGCGPGRGRDTADVFKNAGITVLTNSVYTTGSQKREDLSCNELDARGKRSNDETLEELQLSYAWNETLSEYCRRGGNIIADWPCSKRVSALMRREGRVEEDPVVQALKKCCLAVSRATGRGGSGSQSSVQINFASNDINERTNFPESWMYQEADITMGEKTEISQDYQLPHSITTWVVQGVGVSPLHGMCVAENKEILVRSDVFLDVSLPHSVRRFEQVGIVATVYNYGRKGVLGNGDLEAELRMASVEGLCSNAVVSEHGAFVEGSVMVPLNSAKSHTFIVVPLETGEFTIDVYMFSRPREELVRKTLRVMPDGVQQRSSRSILLNPAGSTTDHLPELGAVNRTNEQSSNWNIMQSTQPADQIQSDFITIKMPLDAIPESSACQMSIIGGIMGPVANASIQGLNVETLLKMPYGCPEQTLSSTAPNVYLYKYVKSVNRDTATIEGESYQYMKDGLARMHNQNYVKGDGSYHNNVRLTAYALKIYCKATEFVPAVDEKFICNGLQWLTTKQNPDGSFPSYYIGTAGETAYVISAIFDCFCADLNMKPSVNSATAYLESQLQFIAEDPQQMAIVTYALALANSTRKGDANIQLRTLVQDGQYGGKFVPYPGWLPEQIEITAYALLAQIQLGDLEYSFSLVKWLTQQRNDMGAWYSTRDTIVGLQALAEYALATQQEQTDLHCTVVAADQPLADWYIDPDNLLVLQAAKTPLDETIVVKTMGVGLATLTVNMTYNTAAETGDALCPFEIVVKPKDKVPLEVESAVENEESSARMEIEVCARYLEGSSTDMAIIDVGLMSGFTPIEDTLVKARETPLIDIVSTADQSVIFYAQKIPGGAGVDPLCVKFEAEQKPKVRNVQPARVKVYDYYNPEKYCLKFYSAEGRSPLLATIVSGDTRVCAATPCYTAPNRDWDTMDQKKAVENAENKACEATEYYAYNVTVLKKEEDSSFEIYTLNITVLKNGLDKSLELENQDYRRLFLKNKNCADPVLEIDHRYLILGRMNPRYTGDWKGYKYMFDNNSEVFEWLPLFAHCKAKCGGDKACIDKKTQCRERSIKKENPRYIILQEIQSELSNGCNE